MQLLEGTDSARAHRRPTGSSGHLAGLGLADQRRVAGGARQGHHASRHQARKRFHHRRAIRQRFSTSAWPNSPLWIPVPANPTVSVTGPSHAHRRGHRHRGLHVTGAGARRTARRSHRSFFFRRPALRNGHGQASVLRAHLGRNGLCHSRPGPAFAERVHARAAAASAGNHRQVPDQESRFALPDRRGDSSRPAEAEEGLRIRQEPEVGAHRDHWSPQRKLHLAISPRPCVAVIIAAVLWGPRVLRAGLQATPPALPRFSAFPSRKSIAVLPFADRRRSRS
jgi:hypothetical protein